MKIFILCVVIFNYLFAIQTSDRLFDCTEIFKERKSELLVELERIDEQKQALNALKIATDELLKKKEGKLTKQEKSVNKNLQEIKDRESSIKIMLDENKKILEKIKKIKTDKIALTFAKMKPASASKILSQMTEKEALVILQSLKAKVVGQILSKMDSKKASKLTVLLSK